MAIPEPRRAEPDEQAEQAVFFGIYNWSLYLSQAGLLLLLLIFGLLFAWTLRSAPLLFATLSFAGLVLVHGLLLWREDRLALAHFARGVSRRIAALTAGCQGPVLDVGAGLGRTLIGLLRERPGLSAMATDIWDSGQILGNSERQLRRNLEAAGVADRVAIRQADIRNLPFEPETFDCALAVWVLHELDRRDQRVALSELARVVSPSGRILVVEYVQCARNFLVFGLINWHYEPLSHWLDLASDLGFVVERREQSRGITYLVLRTSSV